MSGCLVLWPEEKQDQIVMKSYNRDGKEAFLQELREL